MNLLLRALTLIAVATITCRAWEVDFHYGMVKWLACKSGFNAEDAEMIAASSESPDEGSLYPAPMSVFLYTCLGRDSLASKFIQSHHFPSYGPVPGDPKERAVLPGETENAANLEIRREIAPAPNDIPKEWIIRRLGMTLHPLADSWSHRGIPGIPIWPCQDELSWGHPDDRGGWRSHNADITASYPADAIAASHKIYEQLGKFLSANPQFRARNEIPWADMEKEVESFARANSKATKRQWFESEACTNQSSTKFLDTISLPNEQRASLPIETVPLPKKGSPANFRAIEDVRKGDISEARNFIRLFLEKWIVSGDLDGALEFIDPFEFLLAPIGREVGPIEPGERWTYVMEPSGIKTALGMWLIRDHGLVNALGHGDPTSESVFKMGDKSTSLSDLVAQRRGAIVFHSLSEAIRGPAQDEPFGVFPAGKRESNAEGIGSEVSFVAVFQFVHAPQDALMFIAVPRKGKWRIVSMDWTAQ